MAQATMATGDAARSSSRQPLYKRLSSSQPLQAALILAALLVVFLWTPLTHRGFYAATDLLKRFAVTRDAPAQYRVKNELLGDPVFQMLPSLRWNRDRLWHGQLPVWNPYNGYGAPHLANYQSAVFSPFSLPFYIFDFRVALVIAAFLKLFTVGYCTYLFLRRVRLCHVAALVGAVAFMFSGYHVFSLS